MKHLARMGEYGFVHQVNTGTDYSGLGYTSSKFTYKDPDGTQTDKTCDSVSAAAGTFGWTVTNGFFDQVGKWEVMLTLDLGASGKRKLKHPIVFWIGDSGE